VRTDDHPGEEISEDDWLVQPLEEHCCDGGNAEYYCEILEERVWVHQPAAGVMRGSSPISGQSGTTILPSELFSVIEVIRDLHPFHLLHEIKKATDRWPFFF
jgi:hypothetical protein